MNTILFCGSIRYCWMNRGFRPLASKRLGCSCCVGLYGAGETIRIRPQHKPMGSFLIGSFSAAFTAFARPLSVEGLDRGKGTVSLTSAYSAG